MKKITIFLIALFITKFSFSQVKGIPLGGTLTGFPIYGNLYIYPAKSIIYKDISGDSSFLFFQTKAGITRGRIWSVSVNGVNSYMESNSFGQNSLGSIGHLNNTFFSQDTSSSIFSSSYSNYAGVQYDQDYSSNFTGLSLINKSYADATYAPSSGGNYLSKTLANGKIFIGNGSNIATGQTLSLSGSTGTFTLSNTGVLTMPNANITTRGLLTSADWNTFNNKLSSAFYQTVQSASVSQTQRPRINFGGNSTGIWNVSDNSGNSSTDVDLIQANSVSSGYLSTTDWNTFNNKAPPLSGTGYVYQSGSTTSYTNSIPNNSLANSTISGVALGSNLFNHTAGYGLSGSTYNGSSAISWTADSTVLASKLYGAAKYQAKLNGTGFVKASGTSISYDNSTYLTGNQTVTLSGDVTGSGATAITTSLSTTGVSAGTYTLSTITVDNKGRITSASSGTVSSGSNPVAGTNITVTGTSTVNLASTVTNTTFDSTNTFPIASVQPIYRKQWRGTPYTGAWTSGASNQGFIWFSPYLITKTHQVSDIGSNILVAVAGGTVQYALYNDSSGYPTTLITQTGTITCTTTGLHSYTFGTPILLSAASQTVWMAVQYSSATIAVPFTNNQALVVRPDPTVNNSNWNFDQSITYGNFPARTGTAGGGNALNNVTGVVLEYLKPR